MSQDQSLKENEGKKNLSFFVSFTVIKCPLLGLATYIIKASDISDKDLFAAFENLDEYFSLVVMIPIYLMILWMT